MEGEQEFSPITPELPMDNLDAAEWKGSRGPADSAADLHFSSCTANLWQEDSRLIMGSRHLQTKCMQECISMLSNLLLAIWTPEGRCSIDLHIQKEVKTRRQRLHQVQSRLV